MSLRTAFARSLRTTSSRSTRLAPSQQVFQRSFIKPTNAVLSAEDEEKHRAAYEKHREQVEPKLATVDESFTFQQPKVGPAGGRC
jgi:hypothetical protein